MDKNKIKKALAVIIPIILILVVMSYLRTPESAAPVGTAQDAGQTLTLLDVDDKNAAQEPLALIEDGPEEQNTQPDFEAPAPDEAAQEETAETPVPDEHGTYTTKEDVALYIHVYGKLPENFITKKEAEKLGWTGGSLEPYAPGKCIGGSYFGNYEGILPEKDGRRYTECDIDTLGAKSRGAKRIVFSNDGLIYYTEDHYETFELLYGEEG